MKHFQGKNCPNVQVQTFAFDFRISDPKLYNDIKQALTGLTVGILGNTTPNIKNTYIYINLRCTYLFYSKQCWYDTARCRIFSRVCRQ